MSQLKAIVVSNGIHGIEEYFKSNAEVEYHIEQVTANFNPDLSPYNLLIVPNGSDQIAMLKIKAKVVDFLSQGKTLFCFDGWFTDWIPQNQWVMDNSKKTIDVRYRIKSDANNLMNNVAVDELTFNHGISGWWSCGYIKAAAVAEVILEDTWQRPIIVLDELSTNGTIILTASGPLGDGNYSLDGEEEHQASALAMLYHNLIWFTKSKMVTV
jgi:hypothetical protein